MRTQPMHCWGADCWYVAGGQQRRATRALRAANGADHADAAVPRGRRAAVGGLTDQRRGGRLRPAARRL